MVSDADQKQPLERAVEMVIYAPIGLVQFAKDFAPPLYQQMVSRGRARVEELQAQLGNQVGQARIVGQFAVNTGREQVKREIGGRIDQARARGEELAGNFGLRPSSNGAAEPAPEATPAATTPDEPAEAAPETPAVSTLPIPDYDELSASQVVARLSGLEPDELESVRSYESGKRQRKTILTKIEQLVR